MPKKFDSNVFRAQICIIFPEKLYFSCQLNDILSLTELKPFDKSFSLELFFMKTLSKDGSNKVKRSSERDKGDVEEIFGPGAGGIKIVFKDRKSVIRKNKIFNIGF